MASSSEREDSRHQLSRTSRIYIADLDVNDNDDRHVDADIILVWPYSSATKELSLLLAERDVVLSKTKGQVKVTFHGACARAVATARPGIGHQIKLGLKGSELTQASEELSTPGKKASFSLHFSREVDLTVSSRGNQPQRVRYVLPPTPSPSTGHVEANEDGAIVEFGAPGPGRTLDLSHLRMGKSPAALRTSRVSSSFTEDDDYTLGPGRKRTKFARHSGAWRLTDNSDEEADQAASHTGSPAENDMDRLALHRAPATQPHQGDPVDETGKGHETQDTAMRDIDRPASNPLNTQGISPPLQQNHLQPLIVQRDEDQPLPSAPLIPAERLTPDDIIIAPPPRLSAVASPGLSIVSPSASPAQHSSYLPPQESEIDAAAREPDVLSTFLEAAEAQTLNILTQPGQFPNVDSVSQPENPFPHDGQILVTPTEPIGQTVDLDALQEQIELHHVPPIFAETVEVIDDEDAYEPPGENLPELGLPSQGRRHRSLSTPEHAIVLDDDESESEETDVLEEDGGHHLQSEAESEVFDEDDDDAETDVHQPPDGVVEPAVTRTTEVKTAEAIIETASSETEDDTLSGQPEDEENWAEVQMPAPVAKGEPRQQQIHKGLGNQNVLTPHASQAQMPIQHTSVAKVNVEIPSDVATDLESAQDEICEHLQADKDPVQAEITAANWEKMAQNLFTPQATQRDEASAQASAHATLLTPKKLPPTPSDSQQKETPLIPPEVEVGIGKYLTQLDRPYSESRPRRRLISKPPLSDDLYSEYFTPRKAVPEAESPALVFDPEASNLASMPRQGRVESLSEVDEMREITAHGGEPSSSLARLSQDTDHGTTTDHGYYVPLSHLTEYYNQLMDIMAVCTTHSTEPERAKTGPKDYHTTIHLADPSRIPDHRATVTAQIFRPRKTALPSSRRGDVVLLRNFSVQTKQHRLLLVSNDESSWAVFHLENDDPIRYNTAITGPPVESGDLEHNAAAALFRWWSIEGQDKYSDITIEKPRAPKPRPEDISSRKLPPPSLELRRSPRTTRVRTSDEVSPVLDGQSPYFRAYSPTSFDGATEMLPPPLSASAPRRSPISATPISPSSLSPISTRSQTGKSHVPRYSPETTPRRPRTRSQKDEAASSPPPPQSSTGMAERVDLSEENSVLESVTSVSESSRRHRHERHSTSLIHELRDGTQWVDVESVEVVSVSSEGENDREDGDVPLVADTEKDEIIGKYEKESWHRRTRSQSKSEQLREQEENVTKMERQEDEQPQPTSPSRPRSNRGQETASSWRVTRSRAAQSTANVHELRDGTQYQDK